MSNTTRILRIKALSGIAVASTLWAFTPATGRADSLLYENGPDNFPANVNARPNEQIFNIGTSPVGFGSVSEDFTLSSAATLDRVVFEELTLNLGTSGAPLPATVNWCIGTSFFSCSVGSGSAATLTSKAMGTQAPFYNFASTISVPDLSLSAGKYYLTLGSATDILSTTPHNNDYWGATNGTTGDGEAELVTLGQTSTFTVKNEPSFEVYGTTNGGGGGSGGGGTGVPEPQTLLLLTSGLLSLAFSRRRSRQQ